MMEGEMLRDVPFISPAQPNSIVSLNASIPY